MKKFLMGLITVFALSGCATTDVETKKEIIAQPHVVNYMLQKEDGTVLEKFTLTVIATQELQFNYGDRVFPKPNTDDTNVYVANFDVRLYIKKEEGKVLVKVIEKFSPIFDERYQAKNNTMQEAQLHVYEIYKTYNIVPGQDMVIPITTPYNDQYKMVLKM